MSKKKKQNSPPPQPADRDYRAAEREKPSPFKTESDAPDGVTGNWS